MGVEYSIVKEKGGYFGSRIGLVPFGYRARWSQNPQKWIRFQRRAAAELAIAEHNLHTASVWKMEA